MNKEAFSKSFRYTIEEIAKSLGAKKLKTQGSLSVPAPKLADLVSTSFSKSAGAAPTRSLAHRDQMRARQGAQIGRTPARESIKRDRQTGDPSMGTLSKGEKAPGPYLRSWNPLPPPV